MSCNWSGRTPATGTTSGGGESVERSGGLEEGDGGCGALPGDDGGVACGVASVVEEVFVDAEGAASGEAFAAGVALLEEALTEAAGEGGGVGSVPCGSACGVTGCDP